MNSTEVILAVVMVLALAMIPFLVLPGTIVIAAAVLIWASATGGTAWAFGAAALVLLLLGAVLKYVIPGRKLSEVGVPASTQGAGIVVGVVGFFVIPVIGLFLGFVLGVWLAEVRRLGAGEATESTVHALKAVGLSILIELVVAVIAVVVTLVGMVVLT